MFTKQHQASRESWVFDGNCLIAKHQTKTIQEKHGTRTPDILSSSDTSWGLSNKDWRIECNITQWLANKALFSPTTPKKSFGCAEIKSAAYNEWPRIAVGSKQSISCSRIRCSSESEVIWQHSMVTFERDRIALKAKHFFNIFTYKSEAQGQIFQLPTSNNCIWNHSGLMHPSEPILFKSTCLRDLKTLRVFWSYEPLVMVVNNPKNYGEDFETSSKCCQPERLDDNFDTFLRCDYWNSIAW